MEFAIIAAVIVFLIVVYILYRYLKKKNKNKGTEKKKEPKQKKEKQKKIKEKKSNIVEVKASSVDKVNKFLYRKELKILALISKILPKGYVAFPKIGIDTILEPVGNAELFNLVKNKYVDIVIFDEITMQPKVAVDIFDGSIGDEQMDIVSPDVVEALKLADLPLVSIKVKTEYSKDEVQSPIYKALGFNNFENEEESGKLNKSEEA